MDPIKREEANISHHQNKVVPSNSASQSHKSSTNSNNNNTSNNRNQQSGDKDSNFDDDNEWDIGIGDLIIDLDADIEKSSKQSSDNPVTVNIPIQNPTHSRAESAGRSAYDKTLPAPKPTQKATTTVTSIRTKNLEKIEKEEPATMSSTNSNNKTNAKLSIDHQATLDKGLKMKIKRTKTGTKTSEAKHEIVKAEQNGAATSSDEGPAPVTNKKPHPQIAASSVVNTTAPSPAAASNKRGTSGHRKEKTKEKPPHGPRDKSEVAVTGPSDKTCSCGSDMTNNGLQATCSNPVCIKNRDNDMSLAQRLSSSHIKLSLGGERQNISGNTPNAPGPPKDLNKINSQSHSQPNSNSNSSSSSNSVGLQHSSESTLKAQLSSTALAAALSNSSSTSSISAPSSNSTSDDNVSSPPVKRIKCDPKDMKDVCVGTSVGTITEPDHLGPCEPGTSVTLEGIVWHETEGGVLAVNVTWRGKTYVGTLIDCTKHDWAPPRFCDSPTEELDSRTPKGRGKRGRSANTPTNDLSNFTETRSSVHSKLRNGGAKGRGGRNSSSTGLTPGTSCGIAPLGSNTAGSNTPSTSPTAFLVPRPEKRKSKDESPQPNGSSNTASSVNGSSSTQSVTNPVTGNPVQISVKKVKTLTTPCAISPVLLECPEQDCSKKYKHANGLKYHQSHAHGSVSSVDEDSSQAPESPQRPARSNSPVVATNPSSSTLVTNPSTMPATPIVLNAISSPVGNVSKDSLPNTAPLTPKASITSSGQESSSTSQAQSLTGSLTVNPLTQTPTGNKASLAASNSISATEGLQQNVASGITTTPVRTDSQSKTKPGVLRFGPLPDSQSSQLPQNRPSINPLADQQTPIYPPNQLNSQNNLMKSQNLSKQKKNRKSPGPGDFESAVSNRADDVRSPAYSDISDDSTPVADTDLNDKSKVSHLVDVKKPQEPGALSSMSSLTSPYSQYPFNSVYQQGFFSSEAQGVKSALSQPPLQSAPADYQKNKEPPLDLMNKSQPSDGSMKDSGGNNNQQGNHPGKLMPHYNYPYNSYLPPSYPYNMDPSYNPMSMMSDEAKMASQNPGPGMKDIPSPNEHSKMVNPQMMSSKMNIKSEPKEIKQEMQHPKDQQAPSQPPQNFGPYSGLYHQQRHGLSMPPSREEELRRYYIYPPDQRRSSGPGQTPTNLSAKDERSSQSPHATTPSPVQSQHSASSMQHSSSQSKSMKSSSGSGSSSQQPANLSSNQKSSSKEIKEEKEVKVKQEGQKPTMETQGPPPPPTSQYYLHPPYMGPGPFGYDPSLPMYRNMMVPSPAYSNPYLAQMTRFQTPEDLSRNTNTKALDLLQQHANQYAYNTHKIHELSERALKSPTSNVKVSVSSPSIAAQQQQQQQGPPGSRELSGNPNGGNNGGNIGGPPVGSSSQTNALQKGPGGPLNSNPSQPGSIASLNQPGSINSINSINSKNLTKGGDLSVERGSLISNSPPTQRHVHTHTHHHVGVFPLGVFPNVPYNKIG